MLLRHARAAWAEPGMRDFDRRLDESGVDEARSIGATMARLGLFPEMILCSTARRAVETWRHVAAQLARAQDDATFMQELYDTDAAGYVRIMQSAEKADSVLFIGHNPMIEDVAIGLSAPRESETRRRLAAGFPTAGLAVIGFQTALTGISPESGELEHFLTP